MKQPNHDDVFLYLAKKMVEEGNGLPEVQVKSWAPGIYDILLQQKIIRKFKGAAGFERYRTKCGAAIFKEDICKFIQTRISKLIPCLKVVRIESYNKDRGASLALLKVNDFGVFSDITKLIKFNGAEYDLNPVEIIRISKKLNIGLPVSHETINK